MSEGDALGGYVVGGGEGGKEARREGGGLHLEI